MMAVVQRVKSCSVAVDGITVSSIGRGLLILLGVHKSDNKKDLELLARKCMGLRIFPDEHGKMNLSVADIGGEISVVSQFTLFGDVKRGLRPYFGDAAEPEKADEYYQKFISILKENGFRTGEGVFGAHMVLEIINDGPVTIPLNTRDMLCTD